MRYMGFRDGDEAVIGVVEADTVRPLATIDDFYGDPQRFIGRGPTGVARRVADVDQVPPVPPTARVLCLGLNYQAHIDETGRDRPPAPNIFARWYSSLSCHEDRIRVPSGEPGLDWECELAVIIGAPLVDVAAADAMAGVLGYTCFNDVSARTYQNNTPQWALGKNAVASGPIGPAVVTADELGDPYGLGIQTHVNGETMQASTTDRMIFKIDETIEYITRCVSLDAGDVIATGTPDGVGFRRDPPVFLQPGDVVEVDIERIGILRSHIV